MAGTLTHLLSFIKIKIYNLRNYFDVKRYNTIYIDEELKVDHCLGLVD